MLLHAQIATVVGRIAPDQVRDQHDDDQRHQRAADRDRHNVGRVDGFAVLGDREFAIVLPVERFQLQLGDGDGLLAQAGRGRRQVQLLRLVAVVGHFQRRFEQRLVVAQHQLLLRCKWWRRRSGLA